MLDLCQGDDVMFPRDVEIGGELQKQSVCYVKKCIRWPFKPEAGPVIIPKQIAYRKHYDVGVIT